jgi:hypothetical protein
MNSSLPTPTASTFVHATTSAGAHHSHLSLYSILNPQKPARGFFKKQIVSLLYPNCIKGSPAYPERTPKASWCPEGPICSALFLLLLWPWLWYAPSLLLILPCHLYFLLFLIHPHKYPQDICTPLFLSAALFLQMSPWLALLLHSNLCTIVTCLELSFLSTQLNQHPIFSQTLFSFSTDMNLCICLFAYLLSKQTYKNVKQGLLLITLSSAPRIVPGMQQLLHQHLLNE